MKKLSIKNLVLQIFERVESGFVEVVCPDKTFSFGDPTASLRAMIVVHNENFFRRVLFGGEVGFGESYVGGEWSSPDLVAVIRVAVRNLKALEQYPVLSGLQRIAGRLQHSRRRNTVEGSRRNISYHYDLGNDFYRLFLGPTMAYSSGYFVNTGDSLDTAQAQKFARICQKIRPEVSDHILEIGTGWGGFCTYLASVYGCRVTSTTISKQQYEFASGWVQRAGLSDRIEIRLQDYRELTGHYDHIVSIEMFEAVGHRNYDRFFGVCDRLLKPHGTMVMQTITMNEQRYAGYLRDYDFIQKHVFPGSELASLSGILRSLAKVTDLSLYHAEDIGAHYARTLRAWRKDFHGAAAKLPGLGFDARFQKLWDYYLAFCEGAFLERHIGDLQIVLTKNHNPRALMEEPREQGVDAISGQGGKGILSAWN